MNRKNIIFLALCLFSVIFAWGQDRPASSAGKTPESTIDDYIWSLKSFVRYPDANEGSDSRKHIYRNFYQYTRDNPAIVNFRKVYSDDLDAFDNRDLGKTKNTSIRGYLDLIWYLVVQQKSKITSIEYNLAEKTVYKGDTAVAVMKKTVKIINNGKPMTYAQLEQFRLLYNPEFEQWEIESIVYYGTAEVESPALPMAPGPIITETRYDTIVVYSNDSSYHPVKTPQTPIWIGPDARFSPISRYVDLNLRIGRFVMGAEYLHIDPSDEALYYYPSTITTPSSMTYTALGDMAVLFSLGYCQPTFLRGRDMTITVGAGLYIYNRYSVSDGTSAIPMSFSPMLRLQLQTPTWMIGSFGIAADATARIVPSQSNIFSFSLLPGFDIGKRFRLYASVGLQSGLSDSPQLLTGFGFTLKLNKN
ncbi:MAG: hypothetical protein K5842_03345 [Bacteroidales bacterium]|nr:hypothetical protein [Bacteroidales bacterium]